MPALPLAEARGAPVKRLLLSGLLLASGAAPALLGPGLPHPDLLALGSLPLAMLSAWPAASWWRARRRRTAAEAQYTLKDIPLRDKSVLLGRGFEWTPAEAAELAREAARGAGGGAAHALRADRQADLWMDARDLEHHVLLLGTTGTGKTRMLELLVAQAVRRGDAVAVIDPKGDAGLLARTIDEARRARRPFSLVAPPFPGASVPYNPLARFREPREVADRVAAALPAGGDAEPFRHFAWEAVEAAAAARARFGETISLEGLRQDVLDDPARAARRIARKISPELAKLEPERLAAKLAGRHPEAARLAAFAARPREHAAKLLSALGPALSRLTSGSNLELLSPLTEGFSWERHDRKRGVAYFYLGSLLGGDSAAALARMALLDASAYAGARYAWGGGHGPVSLFVDEAGDAASPAFVQLLNKARGAGLRVVAAAQTAADFEAALGSRAAARQVLANANTVVQFRAAGTEDAEDFAGLAGRRLLPSVSDGSSYEPAILGSGLGPVDDFRAVFSRQTAWRAEDLVPAWAVSQLPRFEFFARASGRIWKGVVPLRAPAPDGPLKAIREAHDEHRDTGVRGPGAPGGGRLGGGTGPGR